MFDQAALDRLLTYARRKGGLDADDIARELPVETITPAEIADVVARLEAAGVSIDLDRSLLARHPGARMSVSQLGARFKLPEEPRSTVPVAAAAGRIAAPPIATADAAPANHPLYRGGWTILVIALLLAFAAIGYIALRIS